MTRIEQPAPAAPQPRPRRRWLRWVLVLVLLLIGLEIFLRLIFGLGSPIREQQDRYTGAIVMPNQRTRRFFATNDINAFGMRSIPITREKPPGVKRIFFIGDSVTYGTTFVDQSKIFTTILQHQLPAKLKTNVQVLNASKGGWAVGNELAYLKSRGTFGADAIIFVLNTGDLTQPFEGVPHPESDGVATPKPLTAIGELWSRYLWPRIHPSPAAAPKSDAGSVAATAPASDLRPQELPILAQLDEARSIAAKNNATFALVLTRAQAEWERPEYLDAIQMFHDWADARRIPLLDMADRFRPHKAQMYQDAIHLSPAGHAVVAQAILDEWDRLTAGSAPPPTTTAPASQPQRPHP